MGVQRHIDPAIAGTVLMRRHEHRILAAMLLLLHLAIWSQFDSAILRALLLAHIGMFLIWQPLWQRDRHLSLRGILTALLVTLVFIIWVNWWLLFLWNILLIGLVGGRVISTSHERYAYLLTLVVLISELLIRTVTQTFNVPPLPASLNTLFLYGLPAITVIIALIPRDRGGDHIEYPVDFFRAITAALLTAMLAIGSLLAMYSTGVAYPNALFQSLLTLALFLFAISWLLSPTLGFSGLAMLWDRSLLNIGTPFEYWLQELAALAEQQQTPDEFLHAAAQALVDLPWVTGLTWMSPRDQGESGRLTRHRIPLEAGAIKIQLCLDRPAGPGLLLHSNLLVQLLGNFYIAKQREQELAQRAHLQAIYETGARVTHDIKNLLQSLQTVMLAIQQGDGTEGIRPNHRHQDEAQELLRRQLPHLTQRLQLALDKLQAPEKSVQDQLPLDDWWEEVIHRNSSAAVVFESGLTTNPGIPTELFDSVLENLLENCRHKHLLEPGLAVKITLLADDDRLCLRVCDNGTAVPATTAERLLRHPVSSAQGLGIGLYQAARQAETQGYALQLVENRDGQVCFELSCVHPAQTQYGLFDA